MPPRPPTHSPPRSAGIPSKEEFVATWGTRMLGLVEDVGFQYWKAGCPADRRKFAKRFERVLEEMATEMYRELTRPGYRCRAGRFQRYEALGDLARAMVENFERAMVPASTLVDGKRVRSFKQLRAILAAHRDEIFHYNPTPRRLMVHAGDWRRFADAQDRRDRELEQAAEEAAYQQSARDDQLYSPRAAR